MGPYSEGVSSSPRHGIGRTMVLVRTLIGTYCQKNSVMCLKVRGGYYYTRVLFEKGGMVDISIILINLLLLIPFKLPICVNLYILTFYLGFR